MIDSLLDVFWVMLWFFLFIIWIWLLISIFSDLFRRDSSGVLKATWVIVLILLPLLGALIYLISNGSDMQRREAESAAELEAAQAKYIREVSTSSPADELHKLAGLRDSGVITDEEFAAQKAKLLA